MVCNSFATTFGVGSLHSDGILKGFVSFKLLACPLVCVCVCVK